VKIGPLEQEMKYMRITAGYIWTDHTTDTETARELNINPVLEKNTELQEILDTTCKSNAT
jgi:hypothetical protein